MYRCVRSVLPGPVLIAEGLPGRNRVRFRDLGGMPLNRSESIFLLVQICNWICGGSVWICLDLFRGRVYNRGSISGPWRIQLNISEV